MLREGGRVVLRFGVFELDEGAGELRRAGQKITIQPKPLALLALLIRERDRIVGQEELFERLWPGTVVTSGSLTRAVSHARRAIDDTHRGSMLRSFPRRGYRFIGEVVETAPAGSDEQPAATPRTLASTGATATPAPAAPARREASTAEIFIGRADALETLREAYGQVAMGRGSVVLVRGPAGIGKTRLSEVFAEEVLRQAPQGPLLLVARSRDGEGVPAFWLWSQILRQLMSEPLLGDEVRNLARSGALSALLPSVGELSPGRGVRNLESPEQRRFMFFDAVTSALASCSERRPLVLVLEDLQWAKTPSLRLLEHLAFELIGSPLLLVATIRDEVRERGHPVERTLSILGQQERTREIVLGGLSRAEVAALLERVIGRPAPAELTSELFARTEGVPLFVREAVRLLSERGDLSQPERIARRGITLPGRALDLLRRSLDALSEPAASLVGAAAVLGRGFALASAAALAEVSRGDALDLLDQAIAAGVIEEAPDVSATYRFTHALFREVAYEALPGGTRARLHLRAALHLENQHAGTPGRVISELAHHHHRALAVGDPERAFEVAGQAALAAARASAHEQVATHYEQALDALDQWEKIDPERRLATLLALGEAYRLSGDRERRREAFSKALASARELEDHVGFARAAIGFCELSEWSPVDDEASTALEQALLGLAPEELALRARVMTRISYLDVGRSRERAEPNGRLALEIARESGEPEAMQEALYTLHYLLAGPDDLEERRQLVAELSEVTPQCTSRDTAIIALVDIACDYVGQGDAVGARRTRSQLRELSGDHASSVMAWHTRVYDTGLALLQGRFDEVEPMARDALLLGRRIRHPYAKACFNGQIVDLHRYRGEPEEVIRIFGPAMSGGTGPTHWLNAIVAQAELALGREERAHEIMRNIETRFSSLPRGIRWTATVLEVALLAAQLRRTDMIPQLCEMLETVETHHGVLPVPINYGGPVARALAQLQEALGVADEASRLYAEAIESAAALGARPMVARTCLEHARLLARSGEVARAKELAAASAEVAEELGMAEVAASARAVIARTGG